MIGNESRFLPAAANILQGNKFTTKFANEEYLGTSPSNEYYFQAWFWDSAIHIMAESIDNPAIALAQLRFLCQAQWRNGHIGHIIYREEDTAYFPGKDVWGTQRRAQSEIISSGIIQPPIVALAVRQLYESTTDNAIRGRILTEIIPAIEKYHQYLKTTHDREDRGLLTIFHPWSSGSDNSNAFDQQMEAISLEYVPSELITFVDEHRLDHHAGDPDSRPIPDDYYRYIYLVTLGKQAGWDYETMADDFPFAVKDVSVNALWCFANEELGKLLVRIGREKDGITYLTWAEQTRQALAASWNERQGGYDNIDVRHGSWEPYYVERFANFMPFLTGEVYPQQLDVLLGKLTDPQMYWADYPVPSVPLNHLDFELKRYWRGPSWPPINYFIIVGLRKLIEEPRYTYSLEQRQLLWKTHEALLAKTIHMIEEQGFYENFNPTHQDEQKNGNGFGNFSWTAAIYMLLMRMQNAHIQKREKAS